MIPEPLYFKLFAMRHAEMIQQARDFRLYRSFRADTAGWLRQAVRRIRPGTYTPRHAGWAAQPSDARP